MAKGTCSIDGCPRTVYARTWCARHYQAWLRHGDPTVRIGFSGVPLRERFQGRYEPCEHGCWLWQGKIGKKTGYGYIHDSGRTRLAHRVSYELFVGPIPEGLTIDHVAARGCVHRHCVNPQHLEAVSPKVNARRSISPAGRNAHKTHCKNGHEFTPENTRILVSGNRNCRICQREMQRARRARRAAN